MFPDGDEAESLGHGRFTADNPKTCETCPEIAARVAGIHVEGPFLAKQEGPRGAHPVEHMRPPDWDEFQRMRDATGERIVILTLSPEYDAAPRFIERVVASGVIVSLGHTAATEEQIRAAVDAGAKLGTYVRNGAQAKISRHHNCIWAQLADDRLSVELIDDGHHLPPHVFKAYQSQTTATGHGRKSTMSLGSVG